MKKILGMTIAAIMTMMMVGGATWAYFADTETSAANSLTSGSLDLTIDGGNEVVTTFAAAGVAPGDSGEGVSLLANEGSLAGCLSLQFSTITNIGGTTGEFGDGSGDLGGVAELAVYLDVDRNGVFDGADVGLKYDGTKYSFPATLNYQPVNSYGSVSWTQLIYMNGGDSADFRALWQVPVSAGNEIQGDSVSFDLLFTLGECGGSGGNNAPVVTDIPNQTINEGETFATINLDDYVSDVEDPDSDISWGYSGNTELSVAIVDRVATITAPSSDWNGSENIIFTATDTGGLSDSDGATFTVNGDNDAPVVTDIPNQTINEGETFATINLDDYVSDVEDPDSDISWGYSGNTELSVAIVDRVATVTAPSGNWNGSETITFTATDTGGLHDSDNAIFTVSSDNDAPVVSDIPDQAINEGASFVTINLDDYVSDVEDPDSDISWDYSGNTELSVAIVDRVATVTVPSSEWNGSETITFTATDTGGLYDSDDAVFTVNGINDAPVVSDIPGQTINEGETFVTINLDDYVSDVEDPDADISWDYSGNTDLSVAIVDRVATITVPYNTWSGSETITFTATDTGGLHDSDDAAFTVIGAAAWKLMESGTGTHLTDVWGSSPNDVFVVGHNGVILHYDGTAWSEMDSGINKKLYGVWGTASDNVYAVGYQGYILHYDGSKWTKAYKASKNLYSIWGSAADDIYAVGEKGRVYHYDGYSWSWIYTGTWTHLYDIWGSAADDIYAVGYNGTIVHYNGYYWSQMWCYGVNQQLDSVWGFATDDVYASGNNGTVLHYNGYYWTQMSSGTNHQMEALWGDATDDVTVVGDHGEALHYDGSAWSGMDSQTKRHLEGIWGFATDDIFAVGNNGTIIRYH